MGHLDVAPEMDDNKGTSLLLVHSAAGDEMLHQLVNRIALKEVSLDQASKQNPSLLYSSPAKEEREKILNLCINGEFETVRKYLDEQQEKPRKTTLGDFVKQFLCKAKRFNVIMIRRKMRTSNPKRIPIRIILLISLIGLLVLSISGLIFSKYALKCSSYTIESNEMATRYPHGSLI